MIFVFLSRAYQVQLPLRPCFGDSCFLHAQEKNLLRFSRLPAGVKATLAARLRLPWALDSWQSFPARQQAYYDNPEQLAQVLCNIRQFPPLVNANEIETLRKDLADAARGKRFILQGGDCAERFADCNSQSIVNKLKILLQMSIILAYGGKKPIIPIGRIAGQYAKPRSDAHEWVNGKKIPIFRGDNINSFAPTPEQRRPDPDRLIQGYQRSSLTLNYIRALSQDGFTNLRSLDAWGLDFAEDSIYQERYQAITKKILEALTFWEMLDPKENQTRWGFSPLYVSHEGLLLGLEEALTRWVPEKNSFYNLGAHMLWIGDRTRQIDGAHIEYFRGIANPIGIKIGPRHDIKEIIEIISILNPENIPGRITLITRLGKTHIRELLPSLIEEVVRKNLCVGWSIDPMHGNISVLPNGIKTRDFSDILIDLRESFSIHSELKNPVAGVHFELTGENVTECIGGVEGINISDLTRCYESYCDPRLNYKQSLEMAFFIAEMMASPDCTSTWT